MLTSIERHNLIQAASDVAGRAIALTAALANEGASVGLVVASAVALAQKADELKARVVAEVTD